MPCVYSSPSISEFLLPLVLHIISEGLVEVERQDVLKGKYCPGGSAPVLPLNLMLLTDLVLHFSLLNCDHTCERMIWFTLVENLVLSGWEAVWDDKAFQEDEWRTTQPKSPVCLIQIHKYRYTNANTQVQMHKYIYTNYKYKADNNSTQKSQLPPRGE